MRQIVQNHQSCKYIIRLLKKVDPRNFDDIPYVLSNTDVTDNPDENRELFREREHTISGLNSFSTAVVKFEFKSTSTVEVPKLKTLEYCHL